MNKLFLIVSLLFIVLSSFAKRKSNVTSGNLDFHSLLLPVPLTAKFENDSMFTWCGTMVKGNDSKYHLYYSRWPRRFGPQAWVTHSEVAHAVGNSPFGPFVFSDVTLPTRGAEFWDGLCTHNPTIHFFKGKYFLYYMGNTGDGKIVKNDLNWVHRNNQRIGVAIADKPEGPWSRSDIPLIDVSTDNDAPDALMVSNPTVTQMIDGKYLMIYKAVGKKRPLPFGGPVVHLTAISNKPDGSFVKQLKPVFIIDKVEFPAEDPYIWLQDRCYYAIVKDFEGYFTKQGKSLALFSSKNGFDWKLAKNPLVSTLQIIWENGKIQKVLHLERPQLYFENGKPVALLCAADTIPSQNSFNVQIPLK